MFNIKRQTFLYNCFSGTLIYNFTKLKKEIFLKKKKKCFQRLRLFAVDAAPAVLDMEMTR